MSNILNNEEMNQLRNLGHKIKTGLDCNANGDGVPCKTDRLDSVENMKEYLMIHGYKVSEVE